MSSSRDELHELVERLPDEQVGAAAEDLKARLSVVPSVSSSSTALTAPSKSQGSGWPPAWFGIAAGSAADVSERVDEILAEGLGRRPA